MDDRAFPPQEIRSFLMLCVGEWLALRSSFQLETASGAPAGERPEGEPEEDWHRSERGELRISFLEPVAAGEIGGLAVAPPDRLDQRLRFHAAGGFEVEGARGAGRPGLWQLWPDGSLELRLREEGREIRERIWFAKPNLRLRSSIEQRDDGSPGRASFSSEIRRVSRPAAADA